MDITVQEQNSLILAVLEQMKDCVDRDDTYTTCKGKSFNLTNSFGICWHVYVHTPDSHVTGIDCDTLKPVFAELGLDDLYPVVSQFTNIIAEKEHLHYVHRNLYRTDTDTGKARIKLLNDLVQYYQEKVQVPA